MELWLLERDEDDDKCGLYILKGEVGSEKSVSRRTVGNAYYEGR